MELFVHFILLAIAYFLGNLFSHLHYKKYGDNPEILFSGYFYTAIVFLAIAIAQCNDIVKEYLVLFTPKLDYFKSDIYRFIIIPVVISILIGVFPLLTHKYLNKLAQKKKSS